MSISPPPVRERVRQAPSHNLHGEPMPQFDRRTSQRIRQEFHAEICEWHKTHTGPVFNVLVQDISTTGLKISHTNSLKVGAKYLLEIPRPNQRPIGVVFSVVHCDQSAGGGEFNVQLEPDDVLDITTRAAIQGFYEPERASNTIIAAVLTSVVAAAVTAYFLFAN